jgi:hypothetical protein
VQLLVHNQLKTGTHCGRNRYASSIAYTEMVRLKHGPKLPGGIARLRLSLTRAPCLFVFVGAFLYSRATGCVHQCRSWTSRRGSSIATLTAQSMRIGLTDLFGSIAPFALVTASSFELVASSVDLELPEVQRIALAQLTS